MRGGEGSFLVSPPDEHEHEYDNRDEGQGTDDSTHDGASLIVVLRSGGYRINIDGLGCDVLHRDTLNRSDESVFMDIRSELKDVLQSY